MDMLNSKGEDNNNNKRKSTKRRKKKKGENNDIPKKFKSCSLEGHARRSHHVCLMNKKNQIIVTGKL